MSARDPGRGRIPALASRIAALAVVESVVYGLVARHAYAEELPAAVPLTLTFIFLVPLAAGYRSVASADEARVGVLTPGTVMLMGLAAGVAAGFVGLLCVILLMPVMMLMALIGGAFACAVRAVRRATLRVPHLLARAAPSPRRGDREALVPPSSEAYTRRERDRARAPARESWQQIIVHTPR